MAISACVVILITVGSETLPYACYILPTNIVYPFTLRVMGINTINSIKLFILSSYYFSCKQNHFEGSKSIVYYDSETYRHVDFVEEERHESPQSRCTIIFLVLGFT